MSLANLYTKIRSLLDDRFDLLNLENFSKTPSIFEDKKAIMKDYLFCECDNDVIFILSLTNNKKYKYIYNRMYYIYMFRQMMNKLYNV